MPQSASKKMPPRVCAATDCGVKFRPRPGGHNALYHSKACKWRVRYPRLDRTKTRANSARAYARIKLDPQKAEERRACVREQRRKTRGWLSNYKMERGCKDCGFNAHPAALQLDHEGPKTASISELRSSIKRMMAEIKNGKCVVRCANCHAVKTWRQKQGKA